MKQEGRTEQEMTESYCFLYPDKSKVLIVTKPDVFLFIYFVMVLSFICFICLAPVVLREGSVGWTLEDNDTRKSITR